MIYNADITIFHRYTDEDTRTDAYARNVVHGVIWFDAKIVNVSKTGLSDADKVTIHAPPGTAVSVGDIVARGVVTEEISADFNVKQLQKKYRCITVTKADAKDYGSNRLRHVEIGGA